MLEIVCKFAGFVYEKMAENRGSQSPFFLCVFFRSTGFHFEIPLLTVLAFRSINRPTVSCTVSISVYVQQGQFQGTATELDHLIDEYTVNLVCLQGGQISQDKQSMMGHSSLSAHAYNMVNSRSVWLVYAHDIVSMRSLCSQYEVTVCLLCGQCVVVTHLTVRQVSLQEADLLLQLLQLLLGAVQLLGLLALVPVPLFLQALDDSLLWGKWEQDGHRH